MWTVGLRIAVLSLVTAAALSGCGSGGSEEPTTDPAITAACLGAEKYAQKISTYYNDAENNGGVSADDVATVLSIIDEGGTKDQMVAELDGTSLEPSSSPVTLDDTMDFINGLRPKCGWTW